MDDDAALLVFVFETNLMNEAKKKKKNKVVFNQKQLF